MLTDYRLPSQEPNQTTVMVEVSEGGGASAKGEGDSSAGVSGGSGDRKRGGGGVASTTRQTSVETDVNEESEVTNAQSLVEPSKPKMQMTSSSSAVAVAETGMHSTHRRSDGWY